MPKREFIVPPYWNKVAKTGDELDKELIFSWINHRVFLF
jgi:5-methyltetrahydrofolate--homocysteine methyltransferase